MFHQREEIQACHHDQCDADRLRPGAARDLGIAKL